MFKGRVIWMVMLCVWIGFSVTACASEAPNIVEQTDSEQSESAGDGAAENTTENKMKLILSVNGTEFSATLEKNQAVEELMTMLEEAPLELSLRDYSGFEKVGSLGTSLTTSNKQTTTRSGDIVLYNGNQMVIFYGSNSWSYTRLAHVDNLSGWEDALGDGDVRVTLTIE